MKMSKKIRAIASAALISAMVMSMSGMSALAAETSVPLTKTVTAEDDTSSKVMAPNTTFEFQVESITVDSNVDIIQPDKTIKKIYINSGVEGGAYFVSSTGRDDSKIKFEPATGSEALRKETSITLNPAVFSAPGVYRYKVSEKPLGSGDENDGITKDINEYYLDLYVLYNPDYESDKTKTEFIVDAVRVCDMNNNKLSALSFDNKYDTGNLTVTKKVTGNQGDKKQEFGITISVKGAAGEKFTYVNGDVESSVLCDSNGNAEIKVSLHNDENIVIYGFSPKDSFNVKEDDTFENKNGYTTSYYLDKEIDNGAGAANLTSTLMGKNETDNKTKDRSVYVKNDKDVTTPTGIVMTFGPYALLLALAGVFAVMFLRKKREDF